MRPARKGPENRGQGPRIAARDGACFNEAGPQGAGKPRRSRPAARPAACFNEAGPQGAGKPASAPAAGAGAQLASMRPARKGPENPAAGRAPTSTPGWLQ